MSGDDDDVVWVDRRQDARIVVSIPGRFSLADRRDMQGERRVFSCRAINVSSYAIALASAVSGKVGDRVIAEIEHLGKLKGSIMRVLERGFIMNIIATAEEREKLATKIEWLGKFKDHDEGDRRAQRRFAPANPYSQIMLPDGSTQTCLVVDLSVSGAALSAEAVPDIGTVVAVGKIVGRVVRHFEGGFAVQFTERQSADEIEKKLLPNLLSR
ncbi:MAG TPA: PilZ domain-containing protein [Xanthobacteraceae bacterium]|nr:PilZ domain-containing protein [Xanthobacteraceae bacterium]